jgi:hypothetical protein
MLKASSLYLALFFILLIPNLAVADEYSELKRFCMWKASAAQVIAMNRDFGLKKTDVIGEYLKQETAYSEQLIVLYLIDKIYGTYEFVTHDTIYIQTNKTCLRDYYIDKTQKVFAMHNLEKNY